ncbi:hypothetical protein BUALT_Bualt04G0123100 [Buddleja alternifolia]|uniref:Vacuolar protein sorting-associated protein 13 VPS13 adaptor binding domain-containing protein n=1 Tax=Buddleja alternifolia TaxID=168488 RepID=A0AAV6XZ32_9LAMI|nr:hypothetical protein BUALT_Bualt04G0123100 [Buddleja alternifolia]
MFFNDMIQRKLATLLLPWLRDDSELELKLGFFRSNGTLNNFSFNTSALNELLDDPSKFCFKEATVEHLSLQFSPFSSAAFTLVVRGLRIVLSLGENEDAGGVKWRRKPRDTTVEERNKALEEIDPEGFALHGAIKKISDITSGTWRTSLMNTVIRYCQLQLHDVHVLLRSPCMRHPLSCELSMKNFGARSQIIGHRCFIRGFISSFFVPSEDSSFDVDINSFEIRSNSENRTRCVFPATNMSALVDLNHYQSISASFRVPALNFLLSPADLSVILLLYGLLSKESKCARSGRQLWNIVATKLSSLLTSPDLSFIKVARTVCLWSRYINTYCGLLLLVGYPVDEKMKQSATLMFRGTIYSRFVKSKWKLIAEIENDLPIEAIAVARRIIRHKVASGGPFDDLQANIPFSKLYQLLVLILSMIRSLLRILFLHKILAVFPGRSPHFATVVENSLLQLSITLNVQEISISLTPDNALQPSVSGKAVSDAAISYSFQVSVDGLFLRYMVSISEQCFTFASGCLKVLSFSTGKAGASSYPEKKWNKEVNKRQIIVCGYPANDISRTSVVHLNHLLEKLWLKWEDSCAKSEGENIPNVQGPWILCEIWSCLTDRGLSDSTSWFWNCSLVVGKVNFNMEYFYLTSVALLLKEIQCALCRCPRGMKYVLNTPKITIEDSPASDWSSKFESYSSKYEMDMIRLLPEKHIQIGALIAGPHIVVSLSNDQFSFEFCNIELVTSPNLGGNVGLSSEDSVETERRPECLGLKEPQEIDIPKSGNGVYRCQGKISLNAYLNVNGLKAYFDGTTENQKYQIIELRPTVAQLRYSRKNHYSLGSSIVAVSAASHWVATGFSSLIFLDELFVLTKIISGVFYEPFASSMDRSNDLLSCEEVSSVETVYSESESKLSRSKQASLVTNTQFFVNSTCELKSFDIVLHNSRKSCSLENGIYISIQQLMIEFIFKEWNMDVIIDAIGLRSTIFRYLPELDGNSDKSELKNLLLSLNFLTEASVSHSKLCLSSRHLEKASTSASLHNTTNESSSPSTMLLTWGDSPLIINTGSLGNHCLLASIVVSGIYIAGCQVKDILVNENRFEKFSASFSVGGKFETISCESKGGSILLEATAVTVFVECFTSYYHRFTELWLSGRSSGRVVVANDIREMTPLDGHPSLHPQQVQQSEVMWSRLEAFSMSLLHPSLVLVERDESGRLQELLVEADFHLNLNLLNTMRRISMSISKFSMLSQIMDIATGLKPEDKDSFRSGLADASGTSPSVSQRGSRVDSSMSNPGQRNLYISPQNYVLKDLQCILEVEGPVIRDQISPAYSNSIWVGNGSISGFDMTISLSQIKMALSAFESFSEILISEGTSKVESTESYSQEPEGSMQDIVADGTIVAIKDVDQHMYIAVRDAESRYDIAGAIHYSLVGERALFRRKKLSPFSRMVVIWTECDSEVRVRVSATLERVGSGLASDIVKYHKPRRWESKVQYFSLISLYAKDNSGESLRLNCQPRSRFVDISCSDDSGPALWRMLPFKPDAYEDAIELESATSLSKRTFHLVNKKNDCSMAFADGILEFVSKPGNLFKWKVFDDPGPVGNNSLLNRYLVDGSSPRTGTNSGSDSNTIDMGESRANGSLLGITIMMDKITLTIVHELSDTEGKFPLLQGSIIPNQTIIHITDSKVRVMNTFEMILCYFDAQRNSWVQKILFMEHLVTILMSELSLDILLFVIGQLDLAGPYAVKSSAVLANCCKVENQSGLTLVCQFYNNQDASISARQSTTTLLSHLGLADQPPEASFMSVQLVQQGLLSTSPIHFSLLEPRQFAWRTRIVSSRDSKSYPGPFIVVDISRGVEDGLSVVVSPLLKVHNETDFSLELRFQRPQDEENEPALLMLEAGDIVDDAMTSFRTIDLSGALRKALTSLNVGNYVFSFRPNTGDGSKIFKELSVEWSDDLKGGKPVRLSRIFDKLRYQVRKALSVDSMKVSLSTASCALKSEEGFVADIHFLIQTVGKTVPVIKPDNSGYAPRNGNSPVAMQEQKEIFILPTIEVSNLLLTDINVSLTDRDPQNTMDGNSTWNQATISCGSAVKFYVNPATIFFVVTLTSLDLSCKPVNSSDWMRKLQKQKGDISHLDIELDFGGGKYFAMLRLCRGHRGTLEVGVFTAYALQNDTSTPLLCFSANQKPLSRVDMERFGSGIPPELGSYLPPNSITSWFLKSRKFCFNLLEERAPGTQLDLDALSGLTEIDLEAEENFGSKNILRLGVSLRPSITKQVSSHVVALSPRYVVCNESEEVISIRQCYMEDMEEMIAIDSKQRIALRLRTVIRNKKATNVVENLLRKHTKSQDDASLFIQFRPNQSGIAVHVVEEGSTIVLHFHRPPVTNIPYRIENCLHDAPITYYQKGSSEPETLGAGVSVDYVWDDLTLPHKLVVQLDDVHMLREINLDKVRSWKPFYRNKQTRGLGFHVPLDKKPEDQKRTTYSRLIGTETIKLGYEVYAEGVTRVLRICELTDSQKVKVVPSSSTKMRLRISYIALHLLDHAKQEVDVDEPSNNAPIIITRLQRINWDSMFTSQHKYNQLRVQSLSVDEKWVGAPFAAMLRRHQSENSDANDYIFHVAIVLLPTSSRVKQVKYLSIVLQPLDLNLDEETLMKIVPFWRRSLSDSSAPRQQYYFDHFEIHPIKIVASFLPGDSLYSYSSTQDTLRSLLHSVIKVPAIKSKTVELNGVLVTHALITLRELSIKCAQHYSWYAMRSIYIAKGSPLLPPAFASIFDDLASSSLDVFFDPSSGLLNLPGVTLGTLKLISKFIDNKGFSGTKRYFGDLGKTLKTAGSNILFAAVTEVSDSVLRGAETSGLNGMVNGFHQGILKLAMEPSVLGSAFMEGGPDRKIKLDRSPGVDELYIEGYLQAMLDTMYKQEYLRVRVIENQVILKNLPPSSSLIDEIMDHVKGFLASKALLKGESSTIHSLRHIRGEQEWRIGPTVLTLCEHLFVSFVIRVLRKRAGKFVGGINWKVKRKADEEKAIVPVKTGGEDQKLKVVWKWGIGKFVLSDSKHHHCNKSIHMAFMISKNQPPSFSEESEKLSFSTDTDGSNETLGTVSSQLYLKSSSRSLDKDVVLRRLRHHKTLSRVKNTFQSLIAPHSTMEPYEEKWLQHGDVFTSP